jgi:hypothetical protein
MTSEADEMAIDATHGVRGKVPEVSVRAGLVVRDGERCVVALSVLDKLQ